MEKELSLLEVYNWAIRLKDWTELKSAIDEFYNGTPRSAKDESTYKLVKNNGVLDDVNERNIAKYDYVWYNERLCKVVDMMEWSKKDKGIRVEVLDLDNRKSFTAAISSLRYVR